MPETPQRPSTSGNRKDSSGSDDETVSLADVLAEEQQMEEHANAVFAGCDDTHCTYEQGHGARQALYSCQTCTSKSLAGICLACSLHCHEGHDLVELYTKRNFRCDCGNSKFPDFKCKLFPLKARHNSKNTYNQNFQGLYCECHRPYPDPEDEVEDIMIQCCVCEDWFHGRHIHRDIPEDFDEFICVKCMDQNKFLSCYTTLYPQLNKVKSSPVKSVVKPPAVKDDIHVEESSTKRHTETAAAGRANVGDSVVESVRDTTSTATDVSVCKLKAIKESYRVASTNAMASFWPSEWRSKLCKCTDCLNMMDEQKVNFLLDIEDTMEAYENRGNKRCTTYESGMEALQSMDRVQQIEVITEFNSMKENLKEYLKKFADNKKVVRQEDIEEFFEDFKARKRQRTDMSYHCK